ncbi:O-antigen ligase family protein [Lapillicoccus jejuensis]|uniref:O-antigen ligase n=1 Tax=Lapillicoccus jejuensis TaxID=402171 RepID=A0A542E233_9MICO|nr:O-antigen ligase family protein [Lapillicoccus jejuensis]TQJ09386.1 O-antigen ligase [Lapillicoccus jejuensis]
MVLPGALTPFVLPKLTVDAVALGLALLAARRSRLGRPGLLVLVAGLLVLALAALLGGAPLAQLVGRAPRYEGVVSVGVYALAVAAGAWLLGAPGPLRRHLVRATTVAAALVGALAVLQTLGLLTGSTDVTRPGSLLGNATEQGAYGVAVLGLVLGLGDVRRDRWSQVAAVAAVLAVVTSASRGALLGLLVAVAVVAVTGTPVVRRVAFGGLGAVVVLALALPLTRDRLLLLSPLSRQTVSGRWLEWQETLTLLAHHPVLGVGPSGFVTAVPAVQSADYVRLAGADRLDSPHSVPLQVAVAGGALLLVVAVAAVVVLVRAARARRARWATDRPRDRAWVRGTSAAVAGWGAVLLTHFTAPGSTPLLCVLAGSLLAVPRERERPVALRRAAAGVVALAALALALASAAEVPLRSGLLALAAGQGEAGLADLDRAHALRPWDRDLDGLAAHALVTDPPADPARWAPYVERAAAAVPTDAGALVDLAALDRLRGRPDDALVALDRAHAAAPVDAEVLVARARVLAGLGRLDAAVADLTATADLRPRDPLPLTLLAGVYQQQGRLDLAQRAATRAASLGGR